MNMSETSLSYTLVVLSKTTFCRLKVFNIFFKLMSSENGPTNLNPCALRHFNSTVGQIKIKHFKYCIFFKYSIGISFLNIFIIMCWYDIFSHVVLDGEIVPIKECISLWVVTISLPLSHHIITALSLSLTISFEKDNSTKTVSL